MANVQKQFEEFDGSICLSRFGENATLREKRDIIRRKLKERVPGVFQKYGETCPEYSWRDQGSYEMGTGIKPLDSDYDIDQGLYFKVSAASYPDPVVLKKRVHEALEGHTDSVRIRRPCVTVQYHEDEEPLYHVDIAVYVDGTSNLDGNDRLAMGKENSATEHRVWQVANPEGLTNTIFVRFPTDGGARQQFRRVVRYLKRWKDYNFASNGHAAPRGIALTVAAYHDLRVTYSDAIAQTPNDLEALRQLVRAMLGRFTDVWDQTEQRFVRRLAVKLPVEPWSDLCVKMTAKQMEDFEAELTRLRDALDGANSDVDPVDACTRLKKVFGADFPVPPKEKTARVTSAPAVASSSNSGGTRA